MKDGHIKASDTQKVKIVFENHLHIIFNMMKEKYGKFHAKSFIKNLDKKSPEIRIYFDPLRVKYSEKLERHPESFAPKKECREKTKK